MLLCSILYFGNFIIKNKLRTTWFKITGIHKKWISPNFHTKFFSHLFFYRSVYNIHFGLCQGSLHVSVCYPVSMTVSIFLRMKELVKYKHLFYQVPAYIPHYVVEVIFWIRIRDPEGNVISTGSTAANRLKIKMSLLFQLQSSNFAA